MIIKASRISTSSGSGAVANHVLRGPKNEAIELLQGSESELRDAMRDASAHGAKYGLRHYKISPGEQTTKEDLKGIVSDLGKEFGFDPASATIVWHQKPRAGGQGFDHHAHALVPEYNNETNRILDWSNSYARHEKISRIAEQKLGHAYIAGRHNASVAHALADDGNDDLATIVEEFAERQRPESAYKTTTHQRSARLGFDQAKDKFQIKQAWEQSDGQQAFFASLQESGISVRPGDKAGIFIAEREGVFIGAVHRLVKEPQNVVAQRLQAPEITAPAPTAPTPPAYSATTPTAPEPATATTEPATAPPATATAEGGQAAPTSEKTPTSAPAQSGAGGGGSVGQSGAQPAPASSSGAIVEGPGDAPGPGASPLEHQAYKKRLYEYDEKRAKSQLATIALLQSHGAKNNDSSTQSPSLPGTATSQKTPEYQRLEREDAEKRRADFARARERRDSANSRNSETIKPNDTKNAQQHRRSVESITRINNTTGERITQPNNANLGSADSNSAQSAQDRNPVRRKPENARQAIANRATQARLNTGLKDLKPELKNLRLLSRELDPAWRDARDNYVKIKADNDKIEKVLSSKPQYSAVDLDPILRANSYKYGISASWKERENSALIAREIAEKARQSRGFATVLLAKFGIKTNEQQQYEVLEKTAETRATAVKPPSREDYNYAKSDGELHAHTAVKTLRQWENRPDVAQAPENKRLNTVVQSAINSGDEQISECMKDGNIEQAREVIRLREFEVARKLAEIERINELRNNNKGPNGPKTGR